jgi:hypothetical protein
MIDEIFSKEIGGGLRGDPHMWQYLKDKLSDLETNASLSEFKATLESHFYKLLFYDGQRFTEGGDVFISSFPKVGMSGGFISINWWIETGIPLLCERYEEYRNRKG